MSSMEFRPIRTRALVPPKDDLVAVLFESLPTLKDGDVVVITSKVVAIHQGRCQAIDQTPDKDDLIRAEADYFLPRELSYRGKALLTIKGYTLLPSAGVDESNANGYYILWPEQIEETAWKLQRTLLAHFGLTKLGIILTDSHSVPLRLGTQGVAIGFAGFVPLRDYRDKKDIFKRRLKATRANLVDPLAAMAVMLMGEGDEQTPIVLIRDVPDLRFTDSVLPFFLSLEQDLFQPLFKIFTPTKHKKTP